MSAAIAESPAVAPLLHYMEPFRPWLDEPSVEEIAVNRPGEVWVRQHGAFERHDLPLSLAELNRIATLAGALRNQTIGPRLPLCSTELPGGERLQICIPPVVPHGTISLTIRKHSSSIAALTTVTGRYQTSQWNQWRPWREARDQSGLLALYDAGDLPAFLAAAVRARLNILICGATGSGKTTLAKTLIGAIDQRERIITIEDTLELQISQPNHVRLLYSKGSQAIGAVAAQHLMEASLRMRPDRVLLQELRDEAAWTYVHEVVSGHPGSITTIHGDHPSRAFRRLFALVKGSPGGAQWGDKTLIDVLTGAVDLIVPMTNTGTIYSIGNVWYAADAARRGEAAADLLREI